MDITDILGGYGGYGGGYSNFTTTIVGMVLSIILAIGGGIALYFTFLSPKNEGKFTGFLGWLYDFLSFKKLMIESLLKILYLIITVYIICSGFALLFSSFLGGLGFIALGLIFTRIGYEFVLLTILLYRNIVDINKKLGATGNPMEPHNAPVFTDISVAVPTPTAVEPTPSPVNSTPVDTTPIPEPEVVAPGPRICPTCNSEVSDDAKFCVSCGSKQN